MGATGTSDGEKSQYVQNIKINICRRLRSEIGRGTCINAAQKGPIDKFLTAPDKLSPAHFEPESAVPAPLVDQAISRLAPDSRKKYEAELQNYLPDSRVYPRRLKTEFFSRYHKEVAGALVQETKREEVGHRYLTITTGSDPGAIAHFFEGPDLASRPEVAVASGNDPRQNVQEFGLLSPADKSALCAGKLAPAPASEGGGLAAMPDKILKCHRQGTRMEICVRNGQTEALSQDVRLACVSFSQQQVVAELAAEQAPVTPPAMAVLPMSAAPAPPPAPEIAPSSEASGGISWSSITGFFRKLCNAVVGFIKGLL